MDPASSNEEVLAEVIVDCVDGCAGTEHATVAVICNFTEHS
jgi:hypothetical protein